MVKLRIIQPLKVEEAEVADDYQPIQLGQRMVTSNLDLQLHGSSFEAEDADDFDLHTDMDPEILFLPTTYMLGRFLLIMTQTH